MYAANVIIKQQHFQDKNIGRISLKLEAFFGLKNCKMCLFLHENICAAHEEMIFTIDL